MTAGRSGSASPPELDLTTVRRELAAGRAVVVRTPTGWLVFYLALALVLLGAGALMLREAYITLAAFDRVLYGAMGVLVVGFGVWTFVDHARRLASDRVALVLEPSGLHDHTQGARRVFVPWSEVRRVFVGVQARTNRRGVHTEHRFVSIDVTDPEALKARVGAFHFAMLDLVARHTGALVNIADTSLPGEASRWAHIIGALADERRDGAEGR